MHSLLPWAINIAKEKKEKTHPISMIEFKNSYDSWYNNTNKQKVTLTIIIVRKFTR